MKLEIETIKTSEEASMEKLLERLIGKISFIQSREEQEKIIDKFAGEIFGKISGEKKKRIADEILSYGILDEFMDDAGIEEIMVNAIKSVFIFSSKKGVEKTGKNFSTLEELNLFIKKLLVLSGKDKLNDINDFHLPNGARANVISSPMGPQITVRKFRHKPLSLIDLVEDEKMLDYDLAAQLWLYSDGLRIKPANILIAGTPGSGKTTLLNALFSFFPPNERIITIEDTLELNTETNENCARLETSERLTMKDLVKNSLRMRPSRVIVGEVRGEEALDLMTAMNIGKICMGTLHASSSREAITRLENSPMNVPTEIIPLIDVFIILKQFYVGNSLKRVISEVSEVGGIEKKVLLSEVAKYDLGRGELVKIHSSVIYRDRLAEAVGGTPKEVLDEVALRKKVLQTLAKKGIRAIPEISEFTNSYYEDTEKALKKIGM